MKKNNKTLIILPVLLFLIFIEGGCSSPSLAPDSKNVKVSREEPSSDCKLVSKVTGTTTAIKGKSEDALKDMIQEAANKGANYLKVLEYSAYGTSVTGMAYYCP